MSWCLFSLIYCMPEASFCKKCISHVLLPQQREGGKWHSYLEANLWKLSLPTRGPIQQVLPPFCWGWAAEVERTGRMAVPLILVRNVRKAIFCRCRYTHTTTSKGRQKIAAGSGCQSRTALPFQGDKMPTALPALLQKFLSGAEHGHSVPCLKWDDGNGPGSTRCSRVLPARREGAVSLVRMDSSRGPPGYEQG